MGDCHERKTFVEAAAICSDAGARLCTAAELRADCTRGTGCGHDAQLVWSSDAQASPSPSPAPSPAPSPSPVPSPGPAPPYPTEPCAGSANCAAPDGPSQQCEDDAGPPWEDDPTSRRYHDGTPATPVLADGTCPDPL